MKVITLYDIKVGDQVKRFYTDCKYDSYATFPRVSRITKTQIVVFHGNSEIKFWKKNGRKVGESGWHLSHIEVIK